MKFRLGARRGKYFEVGESMQSKGVVLSDEEVGFFEAFDLIYRSLCAILYNYVPTSGHPGGSISSGRFVSAVLFDAMDYDVSNPDREDADILSYAAGHKALGLYAIWALRNEVLRIGAPHLLPAEERYQLRLEDLLGFRHNPVEQTPLTVKHRVKPLDGHPTPATPFLRLATGASGVGVGSSLGLAWGARDYYGKNAPRVHIVEGEGGLTPGRVAEALAAAGTASLDNAFVHLDWNQASIDSNRVCREEQTPGDYVQWTPAELFYVHDWNVVFVPDGKDFRQVMVAQHKAMSFDNGQPTAIVYRTIKGWQYGIEGRASHGAGHKLCSDGFYDALEPLVGKARERLPTCCDLSAKRCSGADGPEVLEECLWASLGVIRQEMEQQAPMVEHLAGRLSACRDRLNQLKRRARNEAPQVDRVHRVASGESARAPTDGSVPKELTLMPGAKTTLRRELGRVLNFYNRAGGGAFLVSAADLLGSTSVNQAAHGFPEGYFNAATNPEARLISVGGICEDAMSAIASGLSSYGRHIGVASSYGAFLAPLGHIAARLHAIGNQARQVLAEEPYKPMILVCAHAGVKTGEDGPTHADPQPLQLLQENFPAGTIITLTPWDPQEIWPLFTAALARRPALIAPFVTRPNETVPDRVKLNLAPAFDSRQGVYRLRSSHGEGEGTVVLQGSGVTMAFVNEVLPKLDQAGIDLSVYYVASAELFDALPPARQEEIFPSVRAEEAMGITGFTLPTMYRWIRSQMGRTHTLHPFQKRHYLGSGQAHMVLREAGMDGELQYKAIRRYLDARVRT